MTRARKTYKDLKESKDRARALKDNREGKPQERGGMRNLKAEYEQEQLEEAAEEKSSEAETMA